MQFGLVRLFGSIQRIPNALHFARHLHRILCFSSLDKKLLILNATQSEEILFINLQAVKE